MKLYQNDYKGKWFVLNDEPDDMYGDIGTMEYAETTDEFLVEHIEACTYYGIPEYIGRNEELKRRISDLYPKSNVESEVKPTTEERSSSNKHEHE
jgi:hypothetical protein